jgi:hypothetical protein
MTKWRRIEKEFAATQGHLARGERRLLTALLRQTLSDLRKPDLRDGAKRWLDRGDRGRVPFDALCYFLYLDAERLRRLATG